MTILSMSENANLYLHYQTNQKSLRYHSYNGLYLWCGLYYLVQNEEFTVNSKVFLYQKSNFKKDWFAYPRWHFEVGSSTVDKIFKFFDDGVFVLKRMFYALLQLISTPIVFLRRDKKGNRKSSTFFMICANWYVFEKITKTNWFDHSLPQLLMIFWALNYSNVGFKLKKICFSTLYRTLYSRVQNVTGR